jgi:hypothetical protein
MRTKTVKTYTATIYVGLENSKTHTVYDVLVPFNICREYCDKVGLCVTVTETRFVYMNGWERGCIIGLINYPRFPSTENQISDHAFKIAKMLKDELNQNRVSVVTPTETVMLESDENESKSI